MVVNATVMVKPGQPLERALRLLKRKTEGLLAEYKERQVFYTPTERRKLKVRRAAKKRQKRQRLEMKLGGRAA